MKQLTNILWLVFVLLAIYGEFRQIRLLERQDTVMW